MSVAPGRQHQAGLSKASLRALAAVSSMNTSRVELSMACRRFQHRRARATSGRSCSAARRLFFEADVVAPLRRGPVLALCRQRSAEGSKASTVATQIFKWPKRRKSRSRASSNSLARPTQTPVPINSARQHRLAHVSHGFLPSQAKLGLQIIISPPGRARQSADDLFDAAESRVTYQRPTISQDTMARQVFGLRLPSATQRPAILLLTSAIFSSRNKK
jgi:hypothetical protein